MLMFKIILTVIIITGVLTVIVDPLDAHKRKTSNFQLECQIRSKARDIPIYKFRSLRTGLHVIIAKVEGPIVQGFLTIPTEVHDDDGLPHSLEHLVFLGSEDYPYKGVLDLLANRCLAEGTNAWTDIDHTTYTIMTAGSAGFLNLLPIYLDHLLYPTITEAGFITEVYHITGQGHDAGVVYSEMQARENTGPELTYNKMVRALYPEPSGYHYEFGGMMANLRNYTNLEKIRNYHKEMYRPENLYIIITGQVDPKEVFDTIQPLEDKIIEKGDRGPFVKPWQSSIPPFTESEDIEVLYPSDSEDTSIVRIGWRGPSMVTNLTEFQSMEILMKYLNDVSVSPLPKVFVETENPLASYIDELMIRNAESSFTFSFFGVPENKIHEIKPLLIDTFNQIINGTIPFDINVMRATIHNLILKEESILETSPHYTFSQYIIHDILYGRTCEDLNQEVNQIEWYEYLLTKPSSYWINLLKKYFHETPLVVVKGLPSMAEAQRLQDEEMARVEERKIILGDKGLNELEEKVLEADRLNEIPAPEEVLESIPVPSTSKINFHSLQVYTNIDNHHSGFIPMPDASLIDLKAIPLKMKLNDIKSNFIEIVAVLDTSPLSSHERLYLPLLLDLLLESNIVKNGSEMHYEDVVKNLNADTLKAETQNGLLMRAALFNFGSYFHNVGINLEVEMGKYERGVEWMSDILFRVLFNPERVAVKASKILNSVGDKKREGNTILQVMFNDVVFKKDANVNLANPLRQEKFLNDVIEKLKTNPKEILKDLYNVYKIITNLDNIVIHMSANYKQLAAETKNVTKPWLNFVPDGRKPANMSMNIIEDWEEKIPFNPNQRETGYIVGMGSVESAYLVQTTPAITSYSHEDLPALMMARSYLTQLEGPMWKRIRGKGLAYGYHITVKPNQGTLTLQLARAAQLAEAYKEASRIINYYINGTKEWDRLLFESARSSLIYEIIEREAEISDVIQQSLYATYRKVPHDYNRALLKAIDQVTIEDLHEVALKYFKPMLDPEFSKTIVVCPSSKIAEVQTELSRLGHSLKIIHSLDNTTLSNVIL